MAYDDLNEFWDPALYLPIAGTTYRVPAPRADLGLRLRAIFSDPENDVADQEELDLFQKVMGDAWQKMLDDDVPWPHMVHAGRTACIHYGIGSRAGATFWASPGGQGNPTPPAPKRKTGGNSRTSSKARTGSTTRGPARTGSKTPAAAPATRKQG